MDDYEALKRAGQFREAMDLADAALANNPNDVEARLERAHCGRLLGEFTRAGDDYAQVWAAAEAGGDPDRAVAAMLGLASVERALGHYRQALGMVLEISDLLDDLGDEALRPHLCWLQGTTLRYAGRLDEAAAVLAQGLDLARSLQDREGEGYLLATLGGLARVRGDYRASGAYYADAYSVFRELEDAFGLAYTACGRGNAARMLNDWDQAETFFAEASERYDVFGDIVSYAYTLWAWATLAKMLGDYQQAQTRLQTCKALFDRTGDRRGRAYADLAEAEIELLTAVDPQPALDRIAAAARTYREGGLPLEAAFADALIAAFHGEDLESVNARLADLGTAWRANRLPLNLP